MTFTRVIFIVAITVILVCLGVLGVDLISWDHKDALASAQN
jgi:hypothetical protein